MKRIFNIALAGFAAAALAISLGATGPSFAQMKEKEKTVNVGGAPMYPARTSSRTPSIRRTTPRWSLP